MDIVLPGLKAGGKVCWDSLTPVMQNQLLTYEDIRQQEEMDVLEYQAGVNSAKV